MNDFLNWWQLNWTKLIIGVIVYSWIESNVNGWNIDYSCLCCVGLPMWFILKELDIHRNIYWKSTETLHYYTAPYIIETHEDITTFAEVT